MSVKVMVISKEISMRCLTEEQLDCKRDYQIKCSIMQWAGKPHAAVHSQVSSCYAGRTCKWQTSVCNLTATNNTAYSRPQTLNSNAES